MRLIWYQRLFLASQYLEAQYSRLWPGHMLPYEWPNHALERSVKGLAWGVAGARESIAPAMPGNCLARPAQRER